MAHIEGVIFCDGCGAEINWAPVIIRTRQRTLKYCCEDCAHEIPCECGEHMLLGDEVRASRAHSLANQYPE
jgi:hypothetical protein